MTGTAAYIRAPMTLAWWALMLSGNVVAEMIPAVGQAQQPAVTAKPLVFNEVTVVDVESGVLIPDQQVVIADHRIQAVGSASKLKTPTDAQVVDARGKYLIPGLW